ncbi:hypothetical protein [Sphingomonas pokkalii]|uniref:hypothetical protein n=1 Tax=Sphingomonas pokkalii TaxID=2175090 RepID=UPI001F0C6BF7|nr:hypothetical protein [Sphingomonas pokkalii]
MRKFADTFKQQCAFSPRGLKFLGRKRWLRSNNPLFQDETMCVETTEMVINMIEYQAERAFCKGMKQRISAREAAIGAVLSIRDAIEVCESLGLGAAACHLQYGVDLVLFAIGKDRIPPHDSPPDPVHGNDPMWTYQALGGGCGFESGPIRTASGVPGTGRAGDVV